jgi:hypothetical protein
MCAHVNCVRIRKSCADPSGMCREPSGVDLRQRNTLKSRASASGSAHAPRIPIRFSDPHTICQCAHGGYRVRPSSLDGAHVLCAHTRGPCAAWCTWHPPWAHVTRAPPHVRPEVPCAGQAPRPTRTHPWGGSDLGHAIAQKIVAHDSFDTPW